LSFGSLFGQWKPIGENVGVDWTNGMAMDVCNETTAIISITYEGPRNLFLTTDAGETWREIETPDYFNPTDVAMTDVNHIWYVNEEEIYFTSDQGANWTLQFNDSELTTFINYIHFFDPQNGIAMADGLVENVSPAVFLKTTDGGENWVSMNDSAFGSYSRNAWYEVDFVDMENGFFFANGPSSGAIWKTADSGTTWEETSLKVSSAFDFINVLDFYDTQIGYCANDNIFRRTLDGGESWETFNMGDNVIAVMDIEITPENSDRVWAGDVSGLFLSNDAGETWGAIDLPGEGGVFVRKIQFFDADHGFLLGNDNKLYYIDNASTVTSVGEENETVKTYSLSQNYPNPFNPSTVISYSLPEYSYVSLKVYDILGNEIAELVNKEQTAGNYNIDFSTSAELAAGVYFYRLQAGNFAQTKKMILLK
jgi:photosystem II stability/assembly factor-like uncharacterized protein